LSDTTSRILQNQEHMIDFELTDEQKLIRETAREFSDREIAPRARENDRNEHFDTELVQKMADMGFLGAIVPEDYGGRGADYLTYALIVEEIGRNDSAMRTVVSVVTSLVCSSLVRRPAGLLAAVYHAGSFSGPHARPILILVRSC